MHFALFRQLRTITFNYDAQGRIENSDTYSGNTKFPHC